MSILDPYAVRQVKGPYIKLSPHPDHCESEDALIEYAQQRRAEGAVLAADLFSGAGGLSQGLTDAGIEVVLGVDHYDYAVQTHASRFPGLSTDWDLATAQNVERVSELMKRAGIEVLAGGPPCQPFSKAGRAGIRHLVEKGERDPEDERRNLWRAYLEIVQLAKPSAVIMENVPDIALDNEMFIMRSMVTELEQIGYSVECQVVDTWRYGVPQFRQRFILVALKDGLQFKWPTETARKVSVWNAIGDLPDVEGGARPNGIKDGWWEYDKPRTDFQRSMRKDVSAADRHKIFDHITRPVREDDREAFEQMTASTKYSDLPESLRRYRADIFTDKYKRLDENDLSRTITAHIAKDGYGFIHPRQPRTITVREAARLQTFPDDFRFAGPPSAAFKQIGNAVPVALGRAIGGAVLEALARGDRKERTARGFVEALSEWYRTRNDGELIQPWLRTGNRWKILIAEIFFVRPSNQEVRLVWGFIRDLVDLEPGELPSGDQVSLIENVFAGDRFAKRRSIFSAVVNEMQENPEALWEPRVSRSKLPSIAPGLIDLLELAAPVERKGERSEEPVIVAKGVLRVTSRLLGADTETRNRQSNGRISVGALLGLENRARQAHMGLFEIARQVCTVDKPKCAICPLSGMCAFAQNEQLEDSGALF
ncbi:DNA (cytosine-5-)-methyltransferase [Corynebacterium sanguinis]